jgi:nucleoid DNA-binding protein
VDALAEASSCTGSPTYFPTKGDKMATATKSGPIPLTEAQFIDELLKRCDGMSKADVKLVVKAFKEEVVDCLTNGYKVSLSGLVRFEPKYVGEKKKGEMVRNPATGETQPRAASVPASFRAKAYASSAIAKQFPTTRSSVGKALATQLAPAKRGK